MSKLPESLWDVITIRKESGEEVSPTQIVLFQELERFNRLIVKIKDSLSNLKRALAG
jgi:dynein heavy chain